MSISIVIPVFYEEDNIQAALRKINQVVKTDHEILVIYDLDNDPTVNVVKNYIRLNKNKRISLIKNSYGNRRGVMNAIRTGFKNAKRISVVVTMADLSDDVAAIDKMYKLLQNKFDIICASRYMPGGNKIGGPFIKTLLSKFAGISLHFFAGMPTHDATNAFKLYRRKVLNSITIESTGGFEYSLEILAKAKRLGYKITEIPTTWKDRENGKSRFKLFQWLPSYLRWYLFTIFNF